MTTLTKEQKPKTWAAGLSDKKEQKSRDRVVVLSNNVDLSRKHMDELRTRLEEAEKGYDEDYTYYCIHLKHHLIMYGSYIEE